ncbi:MAG: glycosyltransferase [Planctomycetota bacterium]
MHVDIVRYKPDPNAPLLFNETEHLKLVDLDEVTDRWLRDQCRSQSTALILTSGWREKRYCRALKHTKNPSVVMVDNPFRGNIRQRLASVFASSGLQQCFSHAWVTGHSSYELMRRLGFHPQQILDGLYVGAQSRSSRSTGITCTEPHAVGEKSRRSNTLLYAGRLKAWKGLRELVDVFETVVERLDQPWKLRIAGRGELYEELAHLGTQNTEFLGFLHPDELQREMMNAKVFCLASWDEHWGVAVHEAAQNGLPLLLSDGVRSGESFLIDGYNGYEFRAGDNESLRVSLTRLLSEQSEALLRMGRRSLALSERITVEQWAAKVWRLATTQLEDFGQNGVMV